jgi:hypothetical protein
MKNENDGRSGFERYNSRCEERSSILSPEALVKIGFASFAVGRRHEQVGISELLPADVSLLPMADPLQARCERSEAALFPSRRLLNLWSIENAAAIR